MAAKSTWKGTLKLGFVSQPVEAYGAKDPSSAVKFNQIHAACGGRINEKCYCATCNADVERASLLKGYEVSKGTYVTMTQDEVKACEIPATKVIDLREFVPLASIAPFMIAETHYLAPENLALADAFALIRDALVDVAGVGTLAVGGKEKLIAVVAHGRGMMMHTLRRADEFRDVEEVAKLAQVPKSSDSKTLGLMMQLVASMTVAALDLDNYPNTYRANVQALIARKQAGEPTAAPTPGPKPSAGPSLVEQLKASLAAQPAKDKKAKGKKVVA